MLPLPTASSWPSHCVLENDVDGGREGRDGFEMKRDVGTEFLDSKQ